MNDEKNKAIERCNQLIKPEHANWIGISNQLAINTILNLIDEKDKTIDKIVNEIVGNKKILALMCKHIINKTEIECEKQNLLCDDCIKKYFKEAVENEEE